MKYFRTQGAVCCSKKKKGVVFLVSSSSQLLQFKNQRVTQEEKILLGCDHSGTRGG